MTNLEFAPNETLSSAKFSAKALVRIFRSQANKKSLDRTKKILSDLTHQSPDQIFMLLSARAALKLALESYHLPPNSEIIVQGFTCEAVVLPILALNLKPVYCDIETETLSLDLTKLYQKITNHTKVVILQHTFGMTPKFRDQIIAHAYKNKILVIEDLAHGFHPEIFADSNSTTKLFSWGRSKLISTVHGGTIVFNQKQLADNFRVIYEQLRYPSLALILKSFVYKIVAPLISFASPPILAKLLHGTFKTLGLFTTEISGREREGSYDSWLEKKYPPIFSVLLNEELLKLKSNINDRLHLADIYSQALSHSFNESLPVLRFPVLVEQPKLVKAGLLQQGVRVGEWYRQVVAPVGLELSKVEYQLGTCPKAEVVAKQIVNLPLTISTQQATKITDILRSNHVLH